MSQDPAHQDDVEQLWATAAGNAQRLGAAAPDKDADEQAADELGMAIKLLLSGD